MGLWQDATKNKSFLIVSLVIAILFVLPQLVALSNIPNYNYFSSDKSATQDQDQFLYASRLRAFAVFNFSPDASNLEHANDSSTVERLEPAVFLVLFLLTGSFSFAYFIMLFLSGFFCSLFCLLFLNLLFKNERLCIVLMLLTLTCAWFYYFPPWSAEAISDLLNEIFINPQYMYSSQVSGAVINPYSLFYSSRLYYQMFCYPMLFLSLYLIVRGHGENKFSYLLAGSALIGLFAYAYIYFFMIGMGMLFLVFAYDFLKKLKIAKQTLICFALALLISIPYLFSMYTFMKNPASEDIQERLGAEYGHLFKSTLLSLRFVAVAVLLLIFARGFNAHILALLLISTALLSGMQILIGKNIQVHHFYGIGTVFFFISSCYIAYLVYCYLKIKIEAKIANLSLSVIALALIAIFFLIQINIGNHITGGETSTTYAAKNQLYDYLNSNTANDAVVLSLNYKTNLELSANTGKYLFLPNGYLTTASNGELQERLLLAHKFCNVNSPTVESMLKSEGETETYYYFFHMAYKCNPSHGQIKYCDAEANASGISDLRRVPLEIRNSLMAKYNAMSTSELLIQNKYKIDYIVIGDYERNLGCNPDEIAGETVFSNELYTVVKLN